MLWFYQTQAYTMSTLVRDLAGNLDVLFATNSAVHKLITLKYVTNHEILPTDMPSAGIVAFCVCCRGHLASLPAAPSLNRLASLTVAPMSIGRFGK